MECNGNEVFLCCPYIQYTLSPSFISIHCLITTCVAYDAQALLVIISHLCSPVFYQHLAKFNHIHMLFCVCFVVYGSFCAHAIL